MSHSTVLEISGICKAYAGNPAIQDITMRVASGEVHALVGENGAGKSTLVKIISGGIGADCGFMNLEGKEFRPHSPIDAQRRGVAAVQQELSLSPYLPVFENIWLGHRNSASGAAADQARGGMRHPFALKKRLLAQTAALQKQYSTNIDPYRWISDLSLEEQQVVEILKALAFDPKLIIFDEPTSSLGAENTRWLKEIIARLRRQGRAVIFISHRLKEIAELADTITVFKDGRRVATQAAAELAEDEIVTLMVGHELHTVFPPKADPAALAAAPAAMEARDISAPGIKNLSFSVKQGEIVGLAGLEGQGQHDLLLSLFGVKKILQGQLRVRGRPAISANPSQAIAAGVALVPVDRREEGVVLPLSVGHNIALATLGIRQKFGWIKFKAEQLAVSSTIKRLGIKTQGPSMPLWHLSGGNQQKAAFGKWLIADPAVLLLDNPTRGVDIQSRKDIYHQIRDLAAEGKSIVLSSADSIELIGLCDRVLVLYEGRIVAELSGGELTEEKIVASAIGIGDQRHV